jgi:eukaryotic-like serine/threonine-protein kinase
VNEASPPTQTIAGKYRLVRLIGRGGMGSVWEATHVSLGTTFAIKLIENSQDIDDEVQIRFLNEARAAARLQSRHVVRVFDHGMTDSGEPYIAMELLQGEPLSNRLARVGRLSLEETATIVAQVARALNQAHAQGIIHRDLKPENIFLTREPDIDEECVKVVDFGIAKFPRTSAEMAPCTRTGEVMGTPYYMSPEQARGIKSADHRADLWSMGVIGYRCLVGELPFDGNTLVDLMIRITTGDLPVPSEHADNVPAEFDAWFAKSVARDPDDRFQSAVQLAGELASIAQIPFSQDASLRKLPSLDPAEQTVPLQPMGANATSPKVYSSTLGKKSFAKKTNRAPWLVGAIAIVAILSGVAVFATVRNNAQTTPATSAPESVPPTASPPVVAAPKVPTSAASASASAPSPTESAKVVATVRPKLVRTAKARPSSNAPPATTTAATKAAPAATDVGY